MKNSQMDTGILSRAKGCFMGQCAGDALGQMVEFWSKKAVLHRYPSGVQDMENGGAFNTIAGQPTDDTELALMLARSIVKEKKFDAKKVYESYRYWYNSKPFDCGHATSQGMRGHPNKTTQSNGSLMRISPLGIYGSRFELDTVADWAMQDSRLTHANIVCQKAVAIYATTIATAITTGLPNEELYDLALMRSRQELFYEPSVREALKKAADSLPNTFDSQQQGWVLIAFQNAYYRLLHAKDTEQAIIETVGEGGDTDTNGAICGALVGAVYGVESIPERWRNAVLNCRPSMDNPEAMQPRPECFWAVDVLELAEQLLVV